MGYATRYSFDAKSKVSTWLIEETDMQQPEDCNVQSPSESGLGTDVALAGRLGVDRTYDKAAAGTASAREDVE
jgi:hypothetical protein